MTAIATGPACSVRSTVGPSPTAPSRQRRARRPRPPTIHLPDRWRRRSPPGTDAGSGTMAESTSAAASHRGPRRAAPCRARPVHRRALAPRPGRRPRRAARRATARAPHRDRTPALDHAAAARASGRPCVRSATTGRSGRRRARTRCGPRPPRDDPSTAPAASTSRGPRRTRRTGVPVSRAVDRGRAALAPSSRTVGEAQPAPSPSRSTRRRWCAARRIEGRPSWPVGTRRAARDEHVRGEAHGRGPRRHRRAVRVLAALLGPLAHERALPAAEPSRDRRRRRADGGHRVDHRRAPAGPRA
jgi:hypothetical protein